MEILLTSNVLKVKEINRVTKAMLFKDLTIGDEIRMSIPATRSGGNRRGVRASYLRIENLKTGKYTHKTFNEIEPILSCFEFE